MADAELSSDDVRSLVSLGVAELDGADRSLQSLQRTVLYFLDDANAIAHYDDLRAELPKPGSSARRIAIHRARLRLAERPELATIVDRTIAILREHRSAA